MGFTLRFMLGLALVLAACSLLEGATAGRHIRQALPVEETPEAPTLPDEVLNLNPFPNNENTSKNNASNKIESARQSRLLDGDKQKIDKNEQTEKKPKTENSTEKYTRDNKLHVNKTINNDKDDNEKLDKKAENKNESSVLEDPDVASGNTNHKVINDLQKETTEKVPESKEATPAIRAEGARSLDIDISKYVSPEFHNKNNVYSLSVSPDTEKYTNLHNDLPKSTTSRIPTQESKQTLFDTLTTPLDDDFDKKYQDIEHGVKQKLEYIDHQFPEADYNFKNSNGDGATNISKLFDGLESNDTTVSLNYTKYKNLTSTDSRDKNKVHKEIDVESAQNVDYISSYNKTQTYEDTQKDYKNKIPTLDDDIKSDILSEILPEHNDVKSVQKPTGKPVESKQIEPEIGNEKIPEIINFKDSTSLTKPPSLNQTENQKSLLSNKIETEVVNPVENNMKLKWDFPYGLSTIITTTPRITTVQTTGSTKSGQEEEAVYVPYTKENTINMSKRGSTKYVDTITTTTESAHDKYGLSTVSKEKILLQTKQALANKENKTIEQAVLENQVYPVQIPSPNKDQKDVNNINVTTEKSITTDDTVFSLKLFTLPHAATQKSVNFENKTQLTILNDNLTTSEDLETTTYFVNNSAESTTIVNTYPLEKTSEQESITETTTIKSGVEMTTIFENLTSDTETIISTITPYSTTLEVVTATTNLIKNDEFITTTYKIDASTFSNDESQGFSQGSASSETVSSEEIGNSYPTDSNYSEYSDNYTTVSSNEDGGNTSIKSTSDYSDYDPRSSNSRDLKGSSNDASFSSIDESLNNLDLNSLSTTEKNLNTITTVTEEQTNKTKTTEIVVVTTSDYRENIIIKQTDSLSSTKRPEEVSHEFEEKLNMTDSEEVETEDYGELYHSTLSPRHVTLNPDAIASETTPFIIPLNVSMLDTDPTDSTTFGDNSELGTDDKTDGSGGPIAAIVISCIGGGCLILLAGLLYIMRKRHKKFNYGQRCTPVSLDAYSVDSVSVYNSMRRKGAMRASKRSYGNPAFDDPTSTSHPLNFPALAKFASNMEGISKEFDEIPQVTAQTNELPEGCETKNRYANVIPLPETRVFLNAIDGYPNSDYVNANYVTGPKSTRGYYIACQAPMQNTVDDFWTMVWEQQSKVILMLTHLFENGTEKCVDYLPPSEVLDCHRLFGDFQVTLKKREVKEKYVISILQLKNMVSNSWREVTHLWYLGWPEKGVPFEANSLIAFLIEARSYIKTAAPAENGKAKDTSSEQVVNGALNPEQNPVIVHCSPGTGRTGTVIACDIAIREFELARQVDIPKTVYRIRRDRASSVQTKEQYGFIYKVICLYATKLTGGVWDSL